MYCTLPADHVGDMEVIDVVTPAMARLDKFKQALLNDSGAAGDGGSRSGSREVLASPEPLVASRGYILDRC